MISKFLPHINNEALQQAKEAKDHGAIYDLLVQPLHEELYKRQTFDLLDDLSDAQQLLLTYDYLNMQAGQGGFIQFIQNGYVGLLPSMIEQLYKLGANDMAKVLDDALKAYVLNRDLLEKQTTVEEFAQLYSELKEFEMIDDEFTKLNQPTIQIIIGYALGHLDEFIAMPGYA